MKHRILSKAFCLTASAVLSWSVIGGSGIVWFLAKGTMPISIAIQRVVAQTQSITFLAVPFFIFAGNLMNKTGITPRLMKFSQLIT